VRDDQAGQVELLEEAVPEPPLGLDVERAREVVEDEQVGPPAVFRFRIRRAEMLTGRPPGPILSVMSAWPTRSDCLLVMVIRWRALAT
jgi:hypothetical protein